MKLLALLNEVITGRLGPNAPLRSQLAASAKNAKSLNDNVTRAIPAKVWRKTSMILAFSTASGVGKSTSYLRLHQQQMYRTRTWLFLNLSWIHLPGGAKKNSQLCHRKTEHCGSFTTTLSLGTKSSRPEQNK